MSPAEGPVLPNARENLVPGGEKEIILSDVPAKVQRIRISKLHRTKDDIVVKHASSILKADNFQDVVLASQQTKFMLEKLGIFKKVAITIDVCRGPGARPDGYEVNFDVQETRRLTGGISTLVGTNEGSLLFSLRMPNALGRAEKVNADYTYGTKNAVGYGINFVKPLGGDPTVLLQMGARKQAGEFPWSGYREVDRGIVTDLSFLSVLGVHNIHWEGMWREIGCLPKTSSFDVREQCGHSLRSSLAHILSRDTRDSKVLPNHGYLVKLTKEVAGLGGDARYVKGDLELQYNQPLLLDSVLQLSVAGGVMRPLHPGGEIHLPDRFFLGGPLTLRGFNLKGVGPHNEGCALGASAYACAALHLYTPLPFRPGRGGFGELFRTHLFVNAGNLANLSLDRLNGDQWRSLVDTTRLSYGAGIVLRMGGVARLELNYCWPIRVQKGDSINPGLQFGIGLTFL